MKQAALVAAFCFSGALGVAAGPAAADDVAARPGPINRGSDADGAGLLNKRPPELPALTWLDGRARTLASLRGQVVVIRSFTEGCPFCASTVPAVEAWHRELGPKGLRVLGVYHPKPQRPTTAAEARAAASRLGITFPVANDPRWQLVNDWWLSRTPGTWTSFTFVLDRRGVVRAIHAGGEFHPGEGDHAVCGQDHARLRALVDKLLAE
jgi:peroxiredoxin